eukprot:535933_1
MNFLFKSFLFGILSMTSRIQGQAPGLCESCLQSCARGDTSIQICNDKVGFCNGAYLGQSCGGPSRSVCCSAGSCAIATTPPDTIEILYVGPFPFNICQAVTCIFGICDGNDFTTMTPTKSPIETPETDNPTTAPTDNPTTATDTKEPTSSTYNPTTAPIHTPTVSTDNPTTAPIYTPTVSTDNPSLTPTKTPSFIFSDSSSSSDSSDSDDFFDDFDISDIFDLFGDFDGDYGERLDEFINMVLNNYCSENAANCLDFDPAAHYVFSANKSIETDDNVTDAESLEITLNVNGSIWYILYGLLIAILNIFVCWYFNKSK